MYRVHLRPGRVLGTGGGVCDPGPALPPAPQVMRVVGRQQQIMAHEAKQSGASMTLREAQGLLKAVNFMQQNAQTLREMDYKGLETAINEKVVRDMTHKYGDKDNLWSLGDRAATRGKSTWAPGRAPEPKPEQGGA